MELRAKRIGGGSFIALEYTWAFEGKAQDGLLLISREAEKKRWRAAWLDSWHMRSTLMDCVGELASAGEEAVDVLGEYEVVDQPSWGWRTRVELRDQTLVLSMWNVSPAGAQELAVESLLVRV